MCMLILKQTLDRPTHISIIFNLFFTLLASYRSLNFLVIYLYLLSPNKDFNKKKYRKSNINISKYQFLKTKFYQKSKIIYIKLWFPRSVFASVFL